jgi:hypothetical protein
MPYTIRKVPRRRCYRVTTKKKNQRSRRVFSKCTTLKKAKSQVRLLNAIKYGKWNPNSKTRRQR